MVRRRYNHTTTVRRSRRIAGIDADSDIDIPQSEEQIPPPSTPSKSKQKNNKRKKTLKKCRLLYCAFHAQHTASVALIATHRQEESDVNDINDVNEEELQNDKCNQLVSSSERPMKKIKLDETNNNVSIAPNEDIKSSNTMETKKKKNRKKKKKSLCPPMIITTSTLPTCSKNIQDKTNYDEKSILPRIISINEAMKIRENKSIQIQIKVKPLLILDVNGILCHRVRSGEGHFPSTLLTKLIEMDTSSQLKTDPEQIKTVCRSLYRDAIGHVAMTPIVNRTDVNDLLIFLDTHFTLAVWSSAKKKTLNEIIKLLFPNDIASRLLFVWGQNICDPRPPTADEISTKEMESVYANKPIFVKRLSKVWHQYPLWDERNTLLIDDSPEKCPEKFQSNTLHPPPILGLDISKVITELKKNDTTTQNNDDDTTQQFVSSFCDKVNETKQREFFEKLAEIHDHGDDIKIDDRSECNLNEFLSLFGKEHMGWRG